MDKRTHQNWQNRPYVFLFPAAENYVILANSTYITENLLSLGHPAQLNTVTVRVEHGLVFIPVHRVQFLNKVLNL